jgi:hypothetical protein
MHLQHFKDIPNARYEVFLRFEVFLRTVQLQGVVSAEMWARGRVTASCMGWLEPSPPQPRYLQ